MWKKLKEIIDKNNNVYSNVSINVNTLTNFLSIQV